MPSPSAPRDLISVTSLSLRTPALPSDLWQRPAKAQPLFVSLSISTDVQEEANTDSLLGDSFNYGTVTKAIEKAVSELPPAQDADGIPLEVLAEQLAQVVIFKAKAPNVRLELTRPRALLSAESVGVEIYRSAADYLPPGPTGTRALDPASDSPNGDKLFVRALRRLIIIGINACERLDEQEVIADFEFFAGNMANRLANGARAGWVGWKQVVKQLESHLTTSGPLTIEHLTTALSQIILTPPTSSASASPSTWDVPRTTVRVSKPSALMFAKYPSVQVTRTRSDFFNPDGSLRSALSRGIATSAAAPSSVATTSTSESGASTVSTEPETGAGGAGTHTVVLGVGTNMGERVGNISKALKELEKLGGEGGEKVRVVDTSFLYESEAMYVEEQAKFLNATVKIDTTHEPLALLNLLKSVEESLGREKTFRNGPRVIDLDILFYDDIVFDSREVEGHQNDERWLKIPHASIAEREFVLRPLVDLVPDLVHPSLGSTPITLLSSLLASSPSTLNRVLPLTSSLTHILPTRQTLVMSILNTTPDSFSDGGDHFSLDASLASALEHLKLGAHILDIGGMSTRPGAADVSPEEEAARVVPLVEALRAKGVKAPISVDTFRPEVARAAITAGADIINDVLGGAEEGMLQVMADLDVPVVLMHSRGTPSTMSRLTEYEGGDVVAGVRKELAQRVQDALDAGVKRWNIILDPGIGFAKTGEDNLVLLRSLPASLGHGVPATEEGAWLKEFPSLVGLSRKRFIGTLTGKEVAKDRVLGTAAAVTASVAGGADIVRVHDVEAMVDVVKVADGIYRA